MKRNFKLRKRWFLLLAVLAGVWLYSDYLSFYAAPLSRMSLKSEENRSALSNDWSNFAAQGFSGGSGKRNDPYIIETPEQLAYLAHLVNEESQLFYRKINEYADELCFTLHADIDLSGKTWTPIGRGKDAYRVNFNGAGKRIIGLTIDASDDMQGLFGKLHRSHVKNLTLEKVNIKGRNAVGGIAGHSWGSQFLDCNVSGTIKGDIGVGGITGFSEGTYIGKCASSAEVAGNTAVGGITGAARDLELRSSNAAVRVSGKRDIGGLVGFVEFSEEGPTLGFKDYIRAPLIEGCAVTGTVVGNTRVGGIAGRILNTDTIEKWKNDGEIKYSSVSGKIEGRNHTGGAVGVLVGAVVTECTIFTELSTKGLLLWPRKIGYLVGYAAGNPTQIVSYLIGDPITKPARVYGNTYIKDASYDGVGGKASEVFFSAITYEDNPAILQPEQHYIVARETPLPEAPLMLLGAKWPSMPNPELYGKRLVAGNESLEILGVPFLHEGDFAVLAFAEKSGKNKEACLVYLNVQNSQKRDCTPAITTDWMDSRTNHFLVPLTSSDSVPLQKITTPEELALTVYEAYLETLYPPKAPYFTPNDGMWIPSTIYRVTHDLNLSGKNLAPLFEGSPQNFLPAGDYNIYFERTASGTLKKTVHVSSASKIIN